ncbi:MAG: carboxypeptidase regulatory-like domain-containing protein [Ignavibacteria bacterium]|nr:carboxypeptidase regulatory-like domain-containing protein [Ignavibacteria bacterium]
MKKQLFSMMTMFILMISIVFISSCDNETTVGPQFGNSVIMGQVFDNNNAPLAYANVRVGTKSTLTGLDGKYGLTGLPQGTFYVVFSKQNFKTDSLQTTVSGEDTVTANFTMALGEVIIINGLVVQEEYFGTELSGVNLYDGKPVTQNDTERDIQFKDSNGTRYNFYFHSGHQTLNPVLAGYKTEFSEQLGNITKEAFDTLSSRPDVVGREINPDWDFGFYQTEYFNAFAGTLRPYYSFYLKGRYENNQNNGVRIYGLIFINSLDYNSSTDRYSVTIDIKMNRSAKNKFN